MHKADLRNRTSIGTWHPCGGRFFGSVRYEQRIDGEPTGLHFSVPRWRYHLITGLAAVTHWPIIGALSRALLARMVVEYRWLFNGEVGQA